MATHSEIETHHKLLADNFQKALTAEDLVLVETGDYDDWKRAAWPHTVFFELKKGRNITKQVPLIDQDPLELTVFEQDYQQPTATREKGGSANVFEISRLNGNISLWASWSEEWRSFADNAYGLVGGGWCFFYTAQGEPFIQIFRAEWDQVLLPNGKPARGGNAGQPHWHVDLRAEIVHESKFIVSAAHEAGDSSLVELPTEFGLQSLEPLTSSTTSHSLYRSGIHFGMSASREAPPSGSWKWQLHVDQDFARLRSWAVAVLEYVSDEAKHLQLC
ncbi:MAG TPA: hypothetical protein VK171_11595 [Fimbriimonas sp.]|nr:hypothetical protein [Fimbriimonas sp.]